MAQNKLSPPECVRGMVQLDKRKFNKTISIPILSVKTNLIHSVIITLKSYLLKLEKFKSVHDNSTKDLKLVYLNPDLVTSFNSLVERDRELLQNWNISHDDLKFEDVIMTYENWTAHEIIKAVIPPSSSFSGFSQIGKIIHVNLKDDLLPFKQVIGQVLLEKIKCCESVVCKRSNINNTFRTLDLEVLAGNEDLQTETKENGCKFQLDFRTVYWNPRLIEEHYGIVSKLKPTDVLYDVFCGIGPFAIPAAKRGCTVLANDANEHCCKYLLINKNLNKLKSDFRIFNKDGAKFIEEDLKSDMLSRALRFSPSKPFKIHITMNLPAIAYTFLTSFTGLFRKNELSSYPDQLLPTVHLYCFIKDKENLTEKAKNLVEKTLNCSIENAEILPVRNVAPNKEMMRVSFTLTKQILESDKRRNSCTAEQNDSKKLRIEDTNGDGDVQMMDTDLN